MKCNDLFGKLFAGKQMHPDAPKAGANAEPARIHWQSDLIPREAGEGNTIVRKEDRSYHSTSSVRLEWVSRQTDEEGKPLYTRTPQSVSETVADTNFTAAGKVYATLDQLTVRQESKDSPWYKDMYGRNVLALKERFPCFDSYDSMYENRYFRWYFLCENGRLTCVYHTDETKIVTVTEDVLDVEEKIWKEIVLEHCFDDRKACRKCDGTGKCRHCHGQGEVRVYQDDTRKWVIKKCQVCCGSGKCSFCGGTGEL